MDNILILGPVGSGKSTQAQLLAEYLGVPHLSMGDLLYFVSQGPDGKSQEIRETMEKGELVDDQTVLLVLEEHLKGNEHTKGTVIDGFPRNLIEAEKFTLPVIKVFYLDISDAEAIDRLSKRGREDDTPEIIRKRLEIYHQDTEPVREYYKGKGLLEEVNGARKIDEIAEDIINRLKK